MLRLLIVLLEFVSLVDIDRTLSSASSQVNVTKRPSHRRHQIPDLSRRASSIPKLDLIIESAIRTRRVVQESPRSSDGVVGELALARRQLLPNPPHAVDVGVMEVESRVARAGEDVVPRIASKRKVAAAMDADLEIPWVSFVMMLANSKNGS